MNIDVARFNINNKFNLSLQTRAFFVNFLIGGCGSGAYKWRAYFPAFISSFNYKK